MMRVRITLY